MDDVRTNIIRLFKDLLEYLYAYFWFSRNCGRAACIKRMSKAWESVVSDMFEELQDPPHKGISVRDVLLATGKIYGIINLPHIGTDADGERRHQRAIELVKANLCSMYSSGSYLQEPECMSDKEDDGDDDEDDDGMMMGLIRWRTIFSSN